MVRTQSFVRIRSMAAVSPGGTRAWPMRRAAIARPSAGRVMMRMRMTQQVRRRKRAQTDQRCEQQAPARGRSKREFAVSCHECSVLPCSLSDAIYSQKYALKGVGTNFAAEVILSEAKNLRIFPICGLFQTANHQALLPLLPTLNSPLLSRRSCLNSSQRRRKLAL